MPRRVRSIPASLAEWRLERWWVRANRFPDAVTDTPRRRMKGWREAWTRTRKLRREAIRRGSRGRLVLITLDLPGEIWQQAAHTAARAVTREYAGSWPYAARLEEKHNGQLHAHVVTVAEGVAGFPAWAHVQALHNAQCFVRVGYLRKPVFALVCRSNSRRQVAVANKEAAAERHFQARRAHYAETGSSRLPAASWTGNVPRVRRKVTPPAPGLFLVALVGVLADELARAARWKAVLTARRAAPSPQRHPPLAPTRWPRRRACPHRSERELGHARPPP